jgi:hypothetical protein
MGTTPPDAVWAPAGDRSFALRLARYGARHPVAPKRRTYDADAERGTQRYDGRYANRTWGSRRRSAVGAEDNGPPAAFAEPVGRSRREARRR